MTTEPVTLADRIGADPSDGIAAADLASLRDGVVYLLRRQTRDASMAEDLCNEAFRIVLERLSRQPLADPSALPAYLAQTARNLAIAELRKAARRRTSTGDSETIDAYADPTSEHPGDSLQTRDQARAIRKVLLELPTGRDRALLVRYYLRDEDKAAICRDLNLTEAHFNRVIHRARERFRALLGRHHARRDLLCLALA